MNDQKNLFLAIGISILIIIVFQFLFPQQAMINKPIENEVQNLQPSTTIDSNVSITKNIVKSKNEVIGLTDRVLIKSSKLSGSINLTGAILDDLILLKYKETLDENSKNITLLSPDGTANPYYIETGWKALNLSDASEGGLNMQRKSIKICS